jgi:hypothetical protein
MTKFATCPACGHRIGKACIRYEGFQCPNCGRLVHVDDRFAGISLIVSLVLGVLISYFAGLSGTRFFVAGAVLFLVIDVLANTLAGWFWLRLAVGGSPYGKGSLRITPSDDSPGEKESHQ